MTNKVVTTVTTETCPYCKKSSTVAIIEKPDLVTIKFCSECNATWRIYSNHIDKLTRTKQDPETKNPNEVCPVCWSVLQPNYGLWQLECPDPICNYTKPLGGISLAQEKIRKEFKTVREQVWKTLAEDEVPTDELLTQFKTLQVEYSKFQKNDPHPLRNK